MNNRAALRRSLLAIAIFAVAYLLASALVSNSYYLLMLTLVPIWATLGLSWNVFSGYSGLVSFGHASFFGLGAYTATLLLVHFDVSFWLGIPAAMLVGGLAGLLIGWPTFRLHGVYFALAMLAYPLAFLYVFEWLGYQEVSIPLKRENPLWHMQFDDQRAYIALALVLLVAAMVASLFIERSRWGLSLLAIKQNELAAEAAGIDTKLWKLRTIVASGAIAGAAGALYAKILLVVTPPTVFGMITSAQALIVTLFGGVGTFWGPVIGAAILIPVAEILHGEFGHIIPGIQGVTFGAAIIIVIMLAPEGVYWKIRDRIVARRGAPPASRPAVAVQPPPPRPAPAGPVLEVKGVSKRFGGLQALSDVSFTVAGGEILGIIGPNGAGKTTLFNVLNGFTPPSAGTMRFLGHDLAGLKPNRVCRLGVGRTFQVMRPFTRMTVLQNVVVGAFVAARTDREAEALAEAAIQRVGLGASRDKIAGGLTTKELRLMELARALAAGPTLLLMDEPLAGLGHAEVEELFPVLQQLRRDGLTIVIIEHTMHAMVRLVDRMVVLDHGAVIAEGRPDEVTRDRAVIEAYLGKKWMDLAAD
jgi:ABC-type branched-subunit amino acid transport system ATPase component/ABC-type branched-subunit amino acid transport system permease subunit